MENGASHAQSVFGLGGGVELALGVGAEVGAGTLVATGASSSGPPCAIRPPHANTETNAPVPNTPSIAPRMAVAYHSSCQRPVTSPSPLVDKAIGRGDHDGSTVGQPGSDARMALVIESAARTMKRPRRAFAMISVAAAVVLVGCQAILGIDPDSRHESAFCQAAAAFDSRCHVTDACEIAKTAACASNEAIASPGAVTAFVACGDLAPCPVDGTPTDAGSAYIDCLAAHYGAPSTLLTGVVAGYCTQCGAADIQSCTIGEVAQSLATYDDTILGHVRDECLAKSGTDDAGIAKSCANVTTCLNDIVNAADPPPAACGGDQ